MLQADGYLVDVAGSVAASRELLKKHHYCAMTLDLALPDEDGLRLLRQLRERVPVVVISALASESRERRGGEPLPDGADQVLDWIDKPIDEARLLRALHQTRCARPSEATAPLQQKIAPGM